MAKILKVVDPRLYEQLMKSQQKTDPTIQTIKSKLPTTNASDHNSMSKDNIKEFIIKTIEQVHNNNNKRIEQEISCESDDEDTILMKKQVGGGELHHYVKMRKCDIKKSKAKKKPRAKKNK